MYIKHAYKPHTHTHTKKKTKTGLKYKQNSIQYKPKALPKKSSESYWYIFGKWFCNLCLWFWQDLIDDLDKSTSYFSFCLIWWQSLLMSTVLSWVDLKGSPWMRKRTRRTHCKNLDPALPHYNKPRRMPLVPAIDSADCNCKHTCSGSSWF